MNWFPNTFLLIINELSSTYIPFPQRLFLSLCPSLLESKTFTVEDAVETIGFGCFHIALFLIMGSTGVSAPWRSFESLKQIHYWMLRNVLPHFFHWPPSLGCPFREGSEREQEPCEGVNSKIIFIYLWQVFGYEQINICVFMFWEFNIHLKNGLYLFLLWEERRKPLSL